MTDERTSKGLLPCPFCGSGAHINEDEGYGFYVACDHPECFVVMGECYDRDAMPAHFFHSVGAAAAAWNTRTTHEPEVQRMRDMPASMKLLREIDDYLSRSPAEAIHASSILHQKIKRTLAQPPDDARKLVVSAGRDLLAKARSCLFVFTGEDYDMGDQAEAASIVEEINAFLELTPPLTKCVATTVSGKPLETCKQYPDCPCGGPPAGEK